MFCSKCGANSIEEALFCHKCGVRLRTLSNSDAGTTDMAAILTSGPSSSTTTTSRRATSLAAPKVLAAGTGKPLITFHQFQSKKENTRRSQFTQKSAKKQKIVIKEVKLKIGTITYRPEIDELKVSRGPSTNHAILVSPSAGVLELLQKAVEKHSRFNRKMSDHVDEYFLLYPDKSRVGKLPGTQEDFILERFKEELGKPYDRITLYLCKVTDFFKNMTNELAGVLEDEIELIEDETAEPETDQVQPQVNTRSYCCIII